MSQDYRALIKEMADHLLQGSFSVKLSTAGTLSVDGERLMPKDFSGWMVNFSRSEETKKFASILFDAPSPTSALEQLKLEVRLGQKENRQKLFKADGEQIRSFVYDNVVPFISVTDKNKTVFFDKTTKKITALDYGTYCQVIDKNFQIKPMPCVIEFNPYRPEQMYAGEYLGQECTHINTYSKPQWQFAKKLTPLEAQQYSQISPLIDDFFSHLFPDSDCKEFVYDWLHFALKSRCETYLVMNGAKGVGKNVLSNIICASLVGKENHKIAHKGALDQFNGILSECRMIVFDEFKIVDDEAINALKRYANADQMIERKGIDVGKTEKTYNSYIICNNALTDMKIEWDDRRFSVVDLTNVKLEEAWSADKIKHFLEVIDNPESEELRDFGYWLLYRKPTVMKNAFSVWKSHHFYRLCYTSMPEWAKMIIDEITTGNPKSYYDEAELKMMLKERTNGMNRFPQRTKVEDFLKNYKHKGENYLGTIEMDERTYYLQVNPDFVKSTKDNTGNDWLSLGGGLL